MYVMKWFERKMSISQTVWSGIQYSLLSNDNHQCHPFVYCKEFVLDAVWSSLRKKSLSLYGFFYNPQIDPPVYLDGVRLLLRNLHDNEFSDRIYKCLKFLNKLEKEIGFQKSVLDLCENSDGSGLCAVAPTPDKRGPIFQLTSPGNWMHAPPLLSLLTLMIRIGMVYNGRENIWEHAQKVTERTIQPYQKRDDDHLKRAWNCIRELVENKADRFLPDRIDNWPLLLNNRLAIHECGGIVSLATGQSKWVCPSWYK